jgi:hypothetical protein
MKTKFTVPADVEKPTVTGMTNEGLLYVQIRKCTFIYKVLAYRMKYWATYIENGGWKGINALKKSPDLMWTANPETGKVIDNPNFGG